MMQTRVGMEALAQTGVQTMTQTRVETTQTRVGTTQMRVWRKRVGMTRTRVGTTQTRVGMTRTRAGRTETRHNPAIIVAPPHRGPFTVITSHYLHHIPPPSHALSPTHPHQHPLPLQ